MGSEMCIRDSVIFVPQTNHKKDDLSKSIGEHKLADDKKTPTDSKYTTHLLIRKMRMTRRLMLLKKRLKKLELQLMLI